MCLAVQLSGDGYISAVPKGKYQKEDSSVISVNMYNASHRQSGVTQHNTQLLQKQKIRHKSLAFTDSTEGGEDNLVSDTTDNGDKELIIAQAVRVRANRTKSTLDKLVREPELGKHCFHKYEIFLQF